MKPLQTKDIRSANKMQLLLKIIEKKRVSRAQLAQITGLNKATVSTIVKELLEGGLVEETAVGDSTGGRRPIMLTQREHLGYCVAMDLNVSTVRLAVTDLSNRVIKNSAVSLSGVNYTVNFHRLCEAVRRIMEEMPRSPFGLCGIGVSVRGVVDLDGMIRFIPNLNWRDIDLRVMLEDVFRVPVYVDNDGNLAALAELRDHPGCTEMIVLTVDDVITAGLVSGGRLVRGYLGFANAVGHHTIDCRERVACTCGKYGCWEQYCSNLAVLRDAGRALGRTVDSMEEFIALARRGEKAALETLRRFAHYLAVGVSNLIFILNSERILLNSQLLSAFPETLRDIEREILLPITKTQNIALSRLGPDAALLGASSIVIERFYRGLFTGPPEDGPAPVRL